MKLFNAILETPAAVKPLLAPHERLEKSYSTADTTLLFTNRRLILMPIQDEAVETLTYHALPYRSIAHFGLDPIDSDTDASVLTLWIAGISDPLHITLNSGSETQAIQRTLADYVLNRHSPWVNKQLAMSRKRRIRPFLALGLTGAALLTALHMQKHGNQPQKPQECPGRAALKKIIKSQLLR